jgi:hypothetical protein
MSHKRKLIREKIIETLKANTDVTNLVNVNKIFESRYEPIGSQSDLPCICVYTQKENSESFNDSDRIQHRNLELAVEVVVEGNMNIDDSIDAICLEIEKDLLSRENERNEVWQAIDYSETEVVFGEAGRAPIGAARMIFNINYETNY